MSGRMMRTFKHAGKKAVKFRFTATIEKLIVEGTRSWQPYKLAVVWTRRKRRKTTTSRSWRPGIENPYKGLVEWSKLNPEVLQIEVTLFKNERRGQYESKDWVFVLENETQNGRRKAIATARVDMTNHVNDIPTPKQLNIKFKSLTAKLSSALLSITIRCEFLKEGDPMDSDMRSVAGSTASADTIGLAGVDVCDMTEFDDEDLDNLSRHSGSLNSRGSSTKHQISELTQQIEMLSKGFQNDVELPDGQQSILSVKNRQTSVSSYRSDRASIASSKSSRDTRESGSDQGKDKGDARKTSSDSEEPFENSPEQRRRLRPSIDVVPFVESDKTSHQALSISYSSPATETQKPLLLWCQQVTDGYRGVKLTNFSTSWRNGLAFCAILHRLNPESVDYANLKPLDGWDNLKKAFQGFKEVGFDTEEIYKAMRNNSGGVATKNIIISFLTKVKEYFEKHNLNDIITMLKTEKRNHELQPPQQLILPKLENNVHYLRGPNLADFMREKLLSDLEEKEGEDDVFSCELDEVLDSCNSDGSGQSVSQSATHVQSLGSSHTMSEDTFNKRELAATEDSLARDLLIDMKESFSPCKTEISETTETAETTVFQSPSSTQHIQTTKDNLSQSTSTSQSLNNRPLAPESQQIKMTSGEDNMVSVNESPSESFDDKDTLEIMETSAHVVLPSTIYDSKVSSGIEDDLRVNQGKSEKLSEQSEESPVSERRKRSLALIEKFKVDTLKRYGDSSPAKSVDSKRQKEIQEKAKRLLEETRVSLDLKPSVITHSTEALNYGYPESLSDSPTFNSKYHESKYATLPSRKAFRQEELFIESDDEQLHDGLQSFNAATEKLILGLSSDQVLDERLPPQAGAVLLPISDEELAPSSAKHRNSQKSNHKSNLSDQILLIDDEPCKSKIVKDKPTLEFSSKYVKPTSSDYNGNSCENQDSEYLMISQGIDGTDDDSIKKTPTDNIDRLLDNFFTEKIHEVPEPKHDFQNDIDHSVSSMPNSIAGEKSLAIERDDDDSVVPPLDRKEWTPKITKIPHSPQVSLLQTESLPNSHYSPARDPDIQRLPEKNGKLSTSSTKVPQSNDPITSTPVIPASSVNYKNVVEQPDKTSSKSTTSPIRLRTVNPVNIPEMESFSPILPTAEGKIKPEQIRSKPVSKRLSHRKSSTSSLRQSIAKNDTGQLEHERMLLEEEMRTIDDRATEVQEELQELKKIGHRKGKQREEILMQEWIQLVQKRHAINRQQDQLLLLEQERDLQKQVDEINEQMRPFMEVQEHLKTEEQKEKEKGLLDQLICLVNERDRLIRTVDENEQNALEDDMHVQTNLDQNMSKVFNQEEEKCAIM